MQGDGAAEIAHLEAKCRQDDSALVALAEARRRLGDVDAALRAAREAVARQPDSAAARAALSLVLFDAGRLDESRQHLETAAAAELSRHAPAEAFARGVTEAELDLAFERAEPEADRVIDADRIAREALREAESGGAEQAPGPDSTYSTRTMADLLASQGDAESASRIRAELAGGSDLSRSSWDWGQSEPERAASAATTSPALARLERWLENLQGGRS